MSKNIDKKWLKNELKTKSMAKIAKNLGYSVNTVQKYVKQYGLKSIFRRRMLDLTNQKFGKLTAIQVIDRDTKYHPIWLCICDCGNEVKIKGYNLSSTRKNTTKSCGCSRTTINTQHPHFKGYKEISGTLWKNIKRGASDRKIVFRITKEYVWELFEQQKKKCALSGIEIYFAKSIGKDRKGERTASLDRIDSSQGYIEGNVQWIHKDLQDMKWDKPQAEFINWCKLIAENCNDK